MQLGATFPSTFSFIMVFVQLLSQFPIATADY